MFKRLSILVPTLTTRKHLLDRLFERLTPQLNKQVELLLEIDNGDQSIGTKRNRLLGRARGDYVAFVDDDDLVAPNYVARVLEAIRSDPDVVGFNQSVYIDGKFEEVRVLSNKFGRGTNHLNPTARSLAIPHTYVDSNIREDVDWAERVKPILQSEEYVAQTLYEYWFVPKFKRQEYNNSHKQQDILKELGL